MLCQTIRIFASVALFSIVAVPALGEDAQPANKSDADIKTDYSSSQDTGCNKPFTSSGSPRERLAMSYSQESCLHKTKTTDTETTNNTRASVSVETPAATDNMMHSETLAGSRQR